MILVDDMVADTQVPQARDEGTMAPPAARSFGRQTREELLFSEDHYGGRGQAKASL
jgi:hypothetical protein